MYLKKCRRTSAAASAAVACPRCLDRLDPGFGGLLSGLANLRLLLAHEVVEVEVAGAAGLGDEMPFDRLDRIGSDPAPGGENLGEAVLRGRAAFARGFLQERCGGGLVGGHAGARDHGGV